MIFSKFKEGQILRFNSFPFHYAVYIGNGEIVHYNTDPHSEGIRVGIVREMIEGYLKR